jgi:serine/threonine protein kinase
MQLLCPACHTPLATPPGQVAVACPGCALEVDLSRLGTVAGRPRFVPERDRTGATVGGYRLDARLGAGGMGQVYRGVRDGGGGQQPARVAVKFLAAALAGDPPLRERFQREVKVLEGLDHPAIVRVLASGEDGGVPWFAMTLVDGPSLRGRLAAGPLAAAEAGAVFAAVLAGLAHAHARGVVHRDLKPANVLLAPAGAMLADFGIARPGEALLSAMTRLTETAAVLGTVPYMSPEQRAGGPLDHRSDLFSVGVMLYEALTGVLPQGAFAPPSRLRAGLPARLDAVVLRLLQPRPEDRYPGAAEAARALAAVLAPRPRRWPITLTSAAATVALALLANGGWSALRARTDKSLKDGAQAPPAAVAGEAALPASTTTTSPPITPPPAPSARQLQNLAQPQAPAQQAVTPPEIEPAFTKLGLATSADKTKKGAGRKTRLEASKSGGKAAPAAVKKPIARPKEEPPPFKK